GIGVVIAFLAGYFLGHYTGHSDTTTVAIVTSSAVEGEAASEEEATGASEEETAEGGEAETTEGEAEAEGGKGGATEGGEEAATGGAGNPEAGQEVFATNCSVCHGETGHGGSGGPDLRTMPKAKTEAGAIEQVTDGGAGMPPFKGQLSEEEIKDVAAYVVQ